MNALSKNSLIAVLAAALPALGGEPPKPAAAPVAPPPPPPRSVFVLPMSPREGRDPFFPESTRLFEEIAPKTHTVDSSSFVISGESWERGQHLVIINNHTFGAGDAGDVLTTDKMRVYLRVISVQKSTVVIEANGTKRELKIPDPVK